MLSSCSQSIQSESLDDLSDDELFGGSAPHLRSIVPPQQMGARAGQQNPQAATPSHRSDVGVDIVIASPEVSYTPCQLLISSKGTQLLSSPSTPTPAIAES